MAAQSGDARAARSTTDIDVPQGMHIDSAPRPELTAAENQPDPRGEVMAAIYAKRNKLIEDELNLAAGLASQESASDDAAAAATGTEGDQGTAPISAADNTPASHQEGAVSGAEGGVTAPAAAPAPSAPNKRILIADGQQLEVDDNELVRLAQLGVGSGRRFQEAARMRNEAEAVRQEALRAQQAQIYGAPAPSQTAPQASQAPLDEQRARQLVERLNYGSTEDQVAAINDLVTTAVQAAKGGTPQGPTPAQLVAETADRVTRQITFDRNLDTIANEYKEVFQDRALAIAAADRVVGLRNAYSQQGVQRSDLDLYREACGYMHERYVKPLQAVSANPPGNPSPSVQAASNAPMQDRIERKRAAPQPPAAASKIAADVPQQPAVTASSVVQQMRKARHQPNY